MGNSIVSKAFKVLAFVLILLISFLDCPHHFHGSRFLFRLLGTDHVQRGLTMRWYEYVFYYYGHTIKITLLISAVTVVVNTILGSMAAYKVCMAKNAHSKWIKFFEEILTLPTAIPGIAIGLALAQAYAVMRQSGILILIGHIVFTFPLIFRTVTGALRSTNFRAVDEAAASLGAGPTRRFFTVIFPAIRVSVLSGAINVLLLSLGEFNITFFLYTPFLMTLPVGMYESYASLRIEVGSAFTTLFLVLAIPLSLLLNRLNKSKTM